MSKRAQESRESSGRQKTFRRMKTMKTFFVPPSYPAIIITSQFMSPHINSLKEALTKEYVKIQMQSSKKKINKSQGMPTDKYFFIVDDSKGKPALTGQFDELNSSSYKRKNYPVESSIEDIIKEFDEFIGLGKKVQKVQENQEVEEIQGNSSEKESKSESESSQQKKQIKLKSIVHHTNQVANGRKKMLYVIEGENESKNFHNYISKFRNQKTQIIKVIKSPNQYANLIKKNTDAKNFLLVGQNTAENQIKKFKGVEKAFLFGENIKNCSKLQKGIIKSLAFTSKEMDFALKKQGFQSKPRKSLLCTEGKSILTKLSKGKKNSKVKKIRYQDEQPDNSPEESDEGNKHNQEINVSKNTQKSIKIKASLDDPDVGQENQSNLNQEKHEIDLNRYIYYIKNGNVFYEPRKESLNLTNENQPSSTAIQLNTDLQKSNELNIRSIIDSSGSGQQSGSNEFLKYQNIIREKLNGSDTGSYYESSDPDSKQKKINKNKRFLLKSNQKENQPQNDNMREGNSYGLNSNPQNNSKPHLKISKSPHNQYQPPNKNQRSYISSMSSSLDQMSEKNAKPLKGPSYHSNFLTPDNSQKRKISLKGVQPQKLPNDSVLTSNRPSFSDKKDQPSQTSRQIIVTHNGNSSHDPKYHYKIESSSPQNRNVHILPSYNSERPHSYNVNVQRPPQRRQNDQYGIRYEPIEYRRSKAEPQYHYRVESNPPQGSRNVLTVPNYNLASKPSDTNIKLQRPASGKQNDQYYFRRISREPQRKVDENDSKVNSGIKNKSQSCSGKRGDGKSQNLSGMKRPSRSRQSSLSKVQSKNPQQDPNKDISVLYLVEKNTPVPIIQKLAKLIDQYDSMYLFSKKKDLEEQIKKGSQTYDLVFVQMADDNNLPPLQYRNCYFLREGPVQNGQYALNGQDLTINNLNNLPPYYKHLYGLNHKKNKENHVSHVYYKDFNWAIYNFTKVLKKQFPKTQFRKYFGVKDLPTILPSFGDNDYVILLLDEVGFNSIQEYCENQAKKNVNMIKICIPKSKQFVRLCQMQYSENPIIWVNERELTDSRFIMKRMKRYMQQRNRKI